MNAKDDFRNVLFIVKVCKLKDKRLLVLVSLCPVKVADKDRLLASRHF